MLESKRLELPALPRYEEQGQIRQALKETRNGEGVRVVFVGGQSGTGKSWLVDKALSGTGTASSNTWHARTKFDQRRNAPLSNLRYILQDLIDASKEDDCCGSLKKQMEPHQYQVLKAFLMDGDVVSDSESEEEESKEDPDPFDGDASFMGRGNDDGFDSEEFAYSNTAETQKDSMNVLANTVKSTLRILTNISTVIVELDDIHWGCKITSHMMHQIICDPSLNNLLVCATYRTQEPTAREGFYDWMQELQDKMSTAEEQRQQQEETQSDSALKVRHTSILLDDLSLIQLQQLLADAVNREMEETHDLAETIYGFTHGNFFFTKHFIHKLQDDSLLTFDYNQFKWVWDTHLIKRRSSSSDNVVESLTKRLKKLPDYVQHTLMLASCFGAQFDVRALDVTKTAVEGVKCVYHCIEVATQEQLVIQLNKTQYKFAHDMIQLACFGLFPDDLELCRVNWDIGNLLIQQAKQAHEQGSDDYLLKDDSIFFAAVDLLNLGTDSDRLDCCDDDKLRLLSKVNYKAGCKASKLSAFGPASTYLKAGLQALGDKPFETCYDHAVKIYVLLASTQYVMGHMEESLASCQQVYDNAKSCDDMILASKTMFDVYWAMNDYDKIMEYSFKKLEYLGCKLPRKPNTIYVQMEFQKMKNRLKSLTDEELLALPYLDDSEKEITIQILSRIMFPLYHKEEVALCTLIACHMINMTLNHGWSRTSSGKAFVMAATFIIGQAHDIQEGYRLGQIAEKMTLKDGLNGDNVMTISNVASITKWWLEPVQNGLELFLDSHKVLMKTGRVGDACLATISYTINYFYAGLPLGPLLADVEKFCTMYLEYGQKLAYFTSSPLLQLLRCLTGKEDDNTNMYKGKITAKRNSLGNDSKTGEQTMKSYQMALSFYLGDLPTATKMAEELSNVNPGIMKASFWYSSRRFIMALVAIANYRLAMHMKDKLIVEKHLKYFRRVVKAGAINLVHKLQILEAEYLTISLGTSLTAVGSALFGRKNSTTDDIFAKYDEAVVSASRSGYLQDAALANYLCFQFCKTKQDRMHLAEMYVKRAFELHMSWGAVTVATSIADRHKDMFNSDSVRNSLNVMKDSSTSGGSLRGRARFDANLSLQHKELNVN